MNCKAVSGVYIRNETDDLFLKIMDKSLTNTCTSCSWNKMRMFWISNVKHTPGMYSSTLKSVRLIVRVFVFNTRTISYKDNMRLPSLKCSTELPKLKG